MVASFSAGSMRARFGFGMDGTAYRIAPGPGERGGRAYLVVSSLFPETPRFEIFSDAHIKAAPTLDVTQFHATTQGLFLLQVKSSSVAIIAVPGAEVVSEVPTREPVAALAMSRDGALVAVAHPGSIDLWRLESPGPCTTDTDRPTAPAH